MSTDPQSVSANEPSDSAPSVDGWKASGVLPEGVELLDLNGLYILYNVDDFAYRHIVSHHPAMRRVGLADVNPQWPNQKRDLDSEWRTPGCSPLRRLFMHFWRQGLDFTYLDIGAHVGHTAIGSACWARTLGRALRTYAFEPSPKIHPLLTWSIALNRVGDSVTAVQLAAAETSGRTNFHVFGQNSPVSSLLDGITAHHPFNESSRISVDAVSVDDFVERERISSHLICKIDAEGADLKIVDGMHRAITDRLTPLLIEFTPRLVSSYRDPADALLSLCSHFLLFECVIESDLVETGVRPIEPRREEITAFVRRAGGTPFRYEDVLALPKTMPGLSELIVKLWQDRDAFLDRRRTSSAGASTPGSGPPLRSFVRKVASSLLVRVRKLGRMATTLFLGV